MKILWHLLATHLMLSDLVPALAANKEYIIGTGALLLVSDKIERERSRSQADFDPVWTIPIYRYRNYSIGAGGLMVPSKIERRLEVSGFLVVVGNKTRPIYDIVHISTTARILLSGRSSSLGYRIPLSGANWPEGYIGINIPPPGGTLNSPRYYASSDANSFVSRVTIEELGLSMIQPIPVRSVISHNGNKIFVPRPGGDGGISYVRVNNCASAPKNSPHAEMGVDEFLSHIPEVVEVCSH